MPPKDTATQAPSTDATDRQAAEYERAGGVPPRPDDPLLKSALAASRGEPVHVHEVPGYEGVPRVAMVVPVPFMLTLDSHQRVNFPRGVVKVPEPLSTHWYLKAQGVTLLNDGL